MSRYPDDKTSNEDKLIKATATHQIERWQRIVEPALAMFFTGVKEENGFTKNAIHSAFLAMLSRGVLRFSAPREERHAAHAVNALHEALRDIARTRRSVHSAQDAVFESDETAACAIGKTFNETKAKTLDIVVDEARLSGDTTDRRAGGRSTRETPSSTDWGCNTRGSHGVVSNCASEEDRRDSYEKAAKDQGLKRADKTSTAEIISDGRAHVVIVDGVRVRAEPLDFKEGNMSDEEIDACVARIKAANLRRKEAAAAPKEKSLIESLREVLMVAAKDHEDSALKLRQGVEESRARARAAAHGGGRSGADK